MSTIEIAALPLWAAALLSVVLPTTIAMAIPVLLNRWIGHQRLASNNEVAGFKFAVVGVIYAVLLAFAVIVVWEKFSVAESGVVDEAAAAATIFRLAEQRDPDGQSVHRALRAYLRSAIDKDWPAMESGQENAETTTALDALYTSALTATHDDGQHSASSAEMFRQLNTITTARRTRLQLARGIVPPIIWAVLYGGAILTVGFTFFFGTENVRAQMLMTGMLSLLVFMGLLVIIQIDHPFTGPTRVGSEALQAVLEDFDNK